MNVSIQTKLLSMCILLVLLTTVAISATYWVLTKQDKHRESRQHIQIALDITLDGIAERLNRYTNQFDEFLNRDSNLYWATYLYNEDNDQITSGDFITSYLTQAADKLKDLGYIVSADRLKVYAENKRLLLVYQLDDGQETVGGYLVSETESDSYFSLDHPTQVSSFLLLDRQPIPDNPLSDGIAASYEGDIPETISADLFHEGQKLGFRITAPIYRGEVKTGVLVGEVFYTQSMVEHYASLSKAAINFFARDQFSIGTLPVQTQLEPETTARIASCENILNRNSIALSPVTLDDQEYYQGRCALKNAQGTIGAITVSLSQEIEKQEVRRILTAVLTISGIVSVLAFGFTVTFSRRPIRLIQQMITYIDRIAKGDIPEKITEKHKGEFNEVKQNLNILIDTMNGLLRETNTLIQVVHEGKLDIRGDAKNYGGSWRDLVVGMNSVIDAFVAPISMTVKYLDRIAKGEIPHKITGEYNGDFNEIKTNLNLLIDATQEITRLAEAIAGGNLTVDVEKRSEHDRLMNALNVMIHRLNAILKETDGLTRSIQRGKLDMRSNADAFEGGWRDLVVGMNHVIDAFVAPITMTAEYLDRIAKGDIPHKITEEYTGDFNEIKTNLNLLIDATQEITRLAEAIADGSLNVDVRERSEQDRLMTALNGMIQRLHAILQEMDNLTQAVQEGKLETRGDTEAFAGGWRDLIIGVNNVIDAFVTPIAVTAMTLDRISRGESLEEITEHYKGDFNEIKNNLNKLIQTMNGVTQLTEAIADGNLNIDIGGNSKQGRLMGALNVMIRRLNAILKEVDELTQAIQEGKLDIRGNADAFEGGWQDLVAGVNNVIDAFMMPINVTAGYIDMISNGDIPDRITVEYKGDFNDIKNNLNQCIDTINGLVAEVTRLTRAATEGNLSARGDVGEFQGDFARIVIGINNTLDAVIVPLNAAAEYVDKISKGDIPDRITEEYKGDFNQIKENLNLLIDAMKQVTKLAGEMAQGNLTIEVKERSDQDTLMRSLNAMIQQLKEVVSNVKMTADTLAASSEELNSSAEMMSQGASQQAASAEEVSSSMEQMAANIRQNADNARETEKIALQSADYAEEGGKVVAETVVAMKQIAHKIAIIQEIADQTRMLSLNATIEAARAQEHGKAFSVVAAEVRKLSDVTKKAAEEIDELATSSLDVSQKAGETLNTLVPTIHKTAELVQEISAASSEQNTGAEHVNTAIQQLDHVTQQNAASADEVSSTAENLAIQAEQLQHTIGFFTIGEAVPQTPDTEKHPVKPVASKISPEVPKEETTPEEVKMDKKNEHKTSSGCLLEMDHTTGTGDNRDDEFERY